MPFDNPVNGYTADAALLRRIADGLERFTKDEEYRQAFDCSCAMGHARRLGIATRHGDFENNFHTVGRWYLDFAKLFGGLPRNRTRMEEVELLRMVADKVESLSTVHVEANSAA